jgi:hypothetical protein
MSTTKQSRNFSRGVSYLSEVKRRRRMENLLYTRKRVAQLASEYRSHGLDDATEAYLLQLEVEQVLADEFPSEFEVHIGFWAEEEAAAEHHPLVTSESCTLCKAIAMHQDGGGYDAPLAA